MKRVRVVRYHLQPDLVLDDGETLTPLAVQPITVTATDWEVFVNGGLATSLKELEDAHNEGAES